MWVLFSFVSCKCLGLLEHWWREGPGFILFCRESGFAASSKQAVGIVAWVVRRINEALQVVVFKMREVSLDRNGVRGHVHFVGLICL